MLMKTTPNPSKPLALCTIHNYQHQQQLPNNNSNSSSTNNNHTNNSSTNNNHTNNSSTNNHTNKRIISPQKHSHSPPQPPHSTWLHRYLENLTSPSWLSPMRGNILKKRSTLATSPALCCGWVGGWIDGWIDRWVNWWVAGWKWVIGLMRMSGRINGLMC